MPAVKSLRCCTWREFGHPIRLSIRAEDREEHGE